MKKLLSVIILAVMLASMLAFASLAADEITVYVTISDGKDVVLAYKPVKVSADADIDAALRAAHEKYGKVDDYASADSEYGLSLKKLWGNESGSFGYYFDNTSASSLADKLKDGSHVYAFVYSDTIAWSDSYSYFNVNTVSGKKGDTVELTLTRLGYDESWKTVAFPLSDATLTLDGEALDVKTDKDGKATLKLTKSGVLSATSDSITLVPPVCTVNVQRDSTMRYVILGVCAVIVIVCAAVTITKNKSKK